MALALHDLDGFLAAGSALRVPEVPLRRGAKLLFKRYVEPAAALAQAGVAPAAARELAARLGPPSLALLTRRDSARDGASKLAWRTADGWAVESVILRIATGRTSLCLSTQVGCAADCAFCATGRMGLKRNLNAVEIVEQVVLSQRLLHPEGRTIRNLVFMGMGEPLHNEAAVHEAVAALRDPARYGFADRYIVVSTVGVPAAMVRFARRFPGVRLALSLHSAREEERRRLMPLARRHSLTDLRAAVAEVNALQGRVMIEYLLLAGRTDTAEDLDALAAFLSGLDVHVNLIPWNTIAQPGMADLQGSSPERRRAFASALKRRGFPVTMRHSLGADIEGACGQLVTEPEAGEPA
jgi:23S rRNA (adenine2503-C2)-methyltransferase